MFFHVFVMGFMGPSQSPEIKGIRVPEYPETLMDENIMDQKISDPIQGDAQAGPEKKIELAHHAQIKTKHAGNSENEKEGVILFEKAFIVPMMVIPMKGPQESVHNVFVCKPSCEFHGQKE